MKRLLIAGIVLLGAAMYIVIITGTARTYKTPTESMAPTIPLGARVLVIRSSRANRGDLVVFRYPFDPNTTLLKRVVAIGGDTVEIRDKELFVNGTKVVEPYVIHEDSVVYPNLPNLPEPYRSRDHFGPMKIPPGQLFVLGDNRDRSSDSRYWGAFDRSLVKGRPVLLYLSNRGFWRP